MHMYSIPDLSPAFDRLPEKLVQEVIYSLCDPLKVSREVRYDGYACDFRTPRHLIEVKRASSDGLPNSVARPHAPLGQILFYQVAHELQFGVSLEAVILVYGSQVRKYLTESFTAARVKYGVKLWVLTSLKAGTILDTDTSSLINISEVFNDRS